MKKYVSIVFFTIFLFSNYNALADIYEQFLNENNIPITFIENRFFIDENIEKNDLIRFFELLKLSMDIIADNMANYKTTRTNEGGPFLRNIIIILDGQINIIKDDIGYTRLVYEPTHPDSIRTGDRKGFVEYPNVDIFSELVNLITVYGIYENIIEECQLKKINIPEEYASEVNIDYDMVINDVFSKIK